MSDDTKFDIKHCMDADDSVARVRGTTRQVEILSAKGNEDGTFAADSAYYDTLRRYPPSALVNITTPPPATWKAQYKMCDLFDTPPDPYSTPAYVILSYGIDPATGVRVTTHIDGLPLVVGPSPALHPLPSLAERLARHPHVQVCVDSQGKGYIQDPVQSKYLADRPCSWAWVSSRNDALYADYAEALKVAAAYVGVTEGA